MNTCQCGNPVESDNAFCARCEALRVLEVGTDATEKEIKAAYHVLVKVWHPDRFQVDKALREAAEAKLKDINAAYIFLSSTSSKGGRWQTTRGVSPHAASQGLSPKKGPAANRSATRKRAPSLRPAWSTSRWVFPAFKILFRFAIVLLVILVGRYIWIAFDVQDSTSEVETVFGYGKDSVLKGLEAPKRRFLQAVEQDLQKLHLGKPAPEVLPQAEEPAPAINRRTGEKEFGRQPARVQAAPRKVYSYITIGSTKDEVLAQLGTPSASSENKLVYGRSELYFKDNSVIGWRIDPASSPIRVKLWLASSVDTSLEYFTVGSTKDEVLVIQGTPTAFSEDKFEYGGSEVYFQNNRVVRWKNDPASIPLRAKPY